MRFSHGLPVASLALALAAGCPAVRSDSSVVVLSLDADENTETLHFGYVSVGRTKTRTLLVANTGTTDFLVMGVDPGGGGFSVAPEVAFPVQVDAGAVTSFGISFTSTTVGEHAGRVEVAVELPGPTPSIPASATVVAPEMRVSPPVLDFGATPVGCVRTLAPIATNSEDGPWSAPLVMEGAELLSESPSFEFASHFLFGEEVWEDFPAFVSVTFAPAAEEGEESAVVRWRSTGVQTGTYDLAVTGFGTTASDVRVTDPLAQFPVPQDWFPLSMPVRSNPPPVVTVSTDGGGSWDGVSPADYSVVGNLVFEAGAIPPPGALIRVEFTPEDC